MRVCGRLRQDRFVGRCLLWHGGHAQDLPGGRDGYLRRSWYNRARVAVRPWIIGSSRSGREVAVTHELVVGDPLTGVPPDAVDVLESAAAGISGQRAEPGYEVRNVAAQLGRLADGANLDTHVVAEDAARAQRARFRDVGDLGRIEAPPCAEST